MRHDELFFKKLGRLRNLLWILVGLLPLCTSCKDSESKEGTFDPNAPVEVTNIVPETGIISLPLVISGKNFGDDKSRIKVFFDDVQAVIISVKNDHLYVLNPRQDDGNHTVKVVVDGKEGVLEKKFNYVVTSSVTTVAGSGEDGLDDGTSLEATFDSPDYISIDDKYNIIVTDNRHNTIRLVSLNDSKVTTLVKSSSQLYGTCFSPDFSHLYVSKETSDILYLDLDCTSNWTVSTIQSPTDVKNYTSAVVTDKQGNIFFIGCKGQILKKDILSGIIEPIGIIPSMYISGGEDDFYAAYNYKDEYVYICAPKKHTIFRFNSMKNILQEIDFERYTGILGTLGINNGKRLDATYNKPKGIAFDSKGNMYIADSNNNLIRKIDVEGAVTTLVGKTMGGNKDGMLEDATFRSPCAVTLDQEDFIYVADYSNRKIRCIAIQ